MAESVTGTVTVDNLDELVLQEARKSLNEKSPFWKGVEWFINFLRERVKHFFTEKIKSIPIVGVWASRVGVTVTEILFTVLCTLIDFLKLVFCSPTLWKRANSAAMTAWEANTDNGLLAQTYAYGRKMAGFFLEIIKQCFERAIKAHGLEMAPEEKKDIEDLLDNLLLKT